MADFTALNAKVDDLNTAVTAVSAKIDELKNGPVADQASVDAVTDRVNTAVQNLAALTG